MKPLIRLRGINGDVEGMTWESESLLRIGRLASLEMALADSSVNRRHAEIRSTTRGWRLRDLGSTNGTYLKGARLGPGEWPLSPHDILRFGIVTVVVDVLREDTDSTSDDLNVATAAHVSAGSAKLLCKQRDLFVATVTVLTQAIALKDDWTGNHSLRVLQYSMLLGKHLNLSAEDMRLIQIGTPLHDIGIIGIDDTILKKPGTLASGEFEIMKTHTTKGAKIIEQIPDMAGVIPIVRSHHERWDGQGYPDGLEGEEISHLARIVTVADAFDAMTSDRPYRRGMPADVAFAELEKQRGQQFDPDFAIAFINIRQRVIQEMGFESRP